jgi:quaternary ammonium compound-resistance protein SugE
MAWVALLVAGLLEVIWSFTMKQSDGFTRLLPSAITLVAMVASVVLLSYSMKSLPLGTAYTIWTGIGAVGAFVAGIVFLGEHLSVARVVAAVMIVSGLALMKWSTPA